MAERRSFGTIRALPSGRYQASFIGLDGIRYVSHVTYTDRGDAEQWLNEERRYMEQTGPANWLSPRVRAKRRNVPTLGEYADEWLRTTEHAPLTYDQYERHIRLRIDPALGHLPLNEITKSDVREWWKSMDHNRAVHQTYSLLRTIFNAAIDEEIIDINPCTVKGAGLNSKEKKVKALTPEQVQVLVENMVPRLRLGVIFAAWCNLRSGEFRELRRKDIDLDARVIRVTRQVIKSRAGKAITPPKTDGSVRDVPIPAAIIPIIQAHLDTHVGKSPSSLIFTNQNGNQLSENDWYRAFHRASVLAFAPESARQKSQEIWESRNKKGKCPLPDWDPGFTTHDLRHVALTNAGIAGATLKELQALAGHSTPQMAMRYQEVMKPHMDQVIDNLSNMIVVSSSGDASPES